MPASSKKQQKFMGIVRAIQKGEAPAGKFSKAAQKAAKSMKKSSVKKYAKTKHDDLPIKKEERDYKDEYKKFQSSTKAKKYRAELNKYNRKKGTYGNGDGKDASHKGGKIVGFESQSKNRGRAEKSRLKKESMIVENPAAIAAGVRKAMERAKERELSDAGGKKVKVATALSNKNHPKHKQAKGIIQKIKDKAKEMLSKSKKKKAKPKKQSKGDVNFYARQFGGKVESVNEIRKFHPKKLGDDYMGGYNTPKGDTEMFADKKGRYYIWVKPKGKKERYIDLPKNIKRGKADDLHRKLQKTMGESVNESKAEKEKIFNMLVKRGDTPVDARYEVDKSYDFVKKRFSRASVAKKAEIISTLSKYESVKKEGFGGELKGSQKKKFEKARKENAEQLGYKLTGKGDVNESVNERMDKRQAGETLKQLGGNRFIAMTGAKNFAVGPKGMGFKIGKNAKNVNYVRIDLDRGKDLYDMYFNFVSVRGVKVKSKVKGVYADQLRGMFTKHTGMYTSL